MVSGSQATVRTCNDHSSSKVRSFSSRCGRHNTLSLLTVITKVLVECIIEPASNELGPTCVSNFNEAIKRKCRNWQNILPYRLPVSFIYSCRHYDHHKQKIIITFKFFIEYIWIHINIISFSFLYGFLKTKHWNKIGKQHFPHEGGGMFDNGNVNWCMRGRAFLCRTGHFCVEPGFFVSNHAFCCRTGLLCVERVL